MKKLWLPLVLLMLMAAFAAMAAAPAPTVSGSAWTATEKAAPEKAVTVTAISTEEGTIVGRTEEGRTEEGCTEVAAKIAEEGRTEMAAKTPAPWSAGTTAVLAATHSPDGTVMGITVAADTVEYRYLGAVPGKTAVEDKQLAAAAPPRMAVVANLGCAGFVRTC